MKLMFHAQNGDALAQALSPSFGTDIRRLEYSLRRRYYGSGRKKARQIRMLTP
jgi:hypothetical protein